MKHSWILLTLLTVLFSPLLVAEADSFPYKAFNDKAIKELKLEDQFFTEASSKDPDTVTVFGIIPGTTEATVEKLELVSHTKGLRGILNCLSSAGSNDAAKKVWDNFLNVDEGSKLECGGSEVFSQFRAACVVLASKFKPDDFEKIPQDKRVCFNPAVSALLEAYRTRASIGDAFLEERIQNFRHSSAHARMKAGAYSFLSEGLGRAYLDLAQIKYRYLRLSDYKRYGDELLLSDNDRLGLKVLGECIRQKAPIGLIISYSERGEFPDESYLRSLACIRVNGASSLEELQANWGAMGKAVAGHNIFMRSAYSVVPSRAYDLIVGRTTGVTESFAEDSANSILEIDEFVNGDVAGMRKELQDRFSFKGVGSLSMAQRIVLADVLEKKFHSIYANRIEAVAKWKAYASGTESCVLGEVMGAGIGKVAGVVLRGTSNLPGGWKAVGLVAVVGFTAWGTKETIGSATRLISSYKEIPLNEKISETCGLVSEALEIGPDLSDALKNLRKKGAALKPDETVELPPRTKPEGAEPAKTRVQEDTPATKTDVEITKDAGTKQGQQKAAKTIATQIVTPSVPGKAKVNSVGQKQAQKKVETGLLTKEVVLANDLELTALRNKAKSSDPQVAAKAAADLKIKERQVVKQLFDAAFSDPNFRVQFNVEIKNGRLIYYPKKPRSENIVPKDVQEAFSKFQAGLKDAGIDAGPHLAPHPDGVYIATAADYSDFLGRELKKNWECKKAAAQAAGQSELTLGPSGSTSASALYFEPTIVCPREDQLFALFRNLLQSEPSNPQSAGKTARLRAEAVDAFKGSLDFEQRALFDQVAEIMGQPTGLGGWYKRLNSKPEVKIDQIRKLVADAEIRARKNSKGPNDFAGNPDGNFILLSALALDPDIPPSVDVFGSHFKLLKAAADPAKERKAYFEFKAQEAKAAGNSVLEQKYVDAASKAERDYVETLAFELIAFKKSSKQASESEIVPPEVFKIVASRYGDPSPDDLLILQKINEKLPSLMPEVRENYVGDLIPENHFQPQKLGSGATRTAYLASAGTRDDAVFGYVGKIGPTPKEEVELMSVWGDSRSWVDTKDWRGADRRWFESRGGITPRIYGEVSSGGKRSLLLQQHIPGKPVQELRASGDVAKLIAEEAEVAAIAGFLTAEHAGADIKQMTRIGDLNAKNIVINERTGKGFLVDADNGQFEPRPPHQWLLTLMLSLDLDAGTKSSPEVLLGGLYRIEFIAKKAYGSTEGSRIFKKMLTDLFEAYPTPRHPYDVMFHDNAFRGTDALLIHAVSPDDATRLRTIKAAKMEHRINEVERLPDPYERVYAAFNKFLKPGS